MPGAPRNKRYEELDALRGLAAVMVVLFHLTIGIAPLNSAFKYGTTGVDLFFMISGFVIFMSINKVVKDTDFLINRFIRLYPTYWTSVTFTFILYCLYNNSLYSNLAMYFGNMSMFQYYMLIRDLDGPYWTMIIEMNFYLGIWCLFHFKLLKYVNITGVFLSLVTVAITQFWYDNLGKILVYIPLLQFIPLFFAGSIFYKLYLGKTKQTQNYLMLILCLTCQILLFKFAGRSRSFITIIEYATILTIFFGIFILFVNQLLGFIVNKGTLFIGKISFALYLTHQYVSIKFLLPYFLIKLNIGLWTSIICSFFITIMIGAFITYSIEIPISKKLKARWYSNRKLKKTYSRSALCPARLHPDPINKNLQPD